LIALALLGSAWALSAYDDVALALAGGTTIEGKFLRAASETSVHVMVEDEIVTVQLALVETVKVNGAAQDLAPFREDVAEAWVTRLRPDPRPQPLPGVALGSSLVFAGTGQALLKQGPAFRGYAALQVACIAMEAVAVFYAKDAGLLVTVGALDVGLRGLSGVAAYRTARFRRTRDADRER
jgi:hypothetical protein